MKKINLAITGCLGRMGQQLIKSSKKNKDFNLTTLTESKIINKKFKQNKAEIIKQKINRNKFGFPTYRDINKD